MTWRARAANAARPLDDEYGKGKAHCTECGAEWFGYAICHCATCHLTFGGVTGFDFHRIGRDDDRHCRTPEELTEAGYQPNTSGHWRIPAPAELWKD
jgi:hypothetical protein